MRLIALQEFTYATVPLKIGDRFIAESAEDARLLKGFGKARDDDTPTGYRTANLMGDEVTGPKTRRGRYKRADMRAED